MTRIAHADQSVLDAYGHLWEMVEASMGFVPNSLKVMARRPAILESFLAFAGAVVGPSTQIPQGLKQLVAHAASLSAGCRYCQAHTASTAHRVGEAAEKLENAWNYERSSMFSEAERAAMRFAQAAASVPNGVTEADFGALRQHFSDDEITEILAVVSLFGFLNRWNDSLATTLEAEPSRFGASHLPGWTAGKHEGGAP